MRLLVIQVFATLLAREHDARAISITCKREPLSVSGGEPVRRGYAIFLSLGLWWSPGYFWLANGYTGAGEQVVTGFARPATGCRRRAAPAPSVPHAQETVGR